MQPIARPGSVLTKAVRKTSNKGAKSHAFNVTDDTGTGVEFKKFLNSRRLSPPLVDNQDKRLHVSSGHQERMCRCFRKRTPENPI